MKEVKDSNARAKIANIDKRVRTVESSGGGDAETLEGEAGAHYLDRANHTGEQAQSTVTDLVDDLDAKAPIASPTFTGTVGGVTKSMVGLGNVDNTSDANKPVSTAQQTALDGKVDGLKGVKIYRALLTQTSTNAPVATVLENSLSAPIVWTRDSAGWYIGTLASAFTANKTFLKIGNANGDSADGEAKNTINRDDANSIAVQTGAGGALADDLLIDTPVEILVYPA